MALDFPHHQCGGRWAICSSGEGFGPSSSRCLCSSLGSSWQSEGRPWAGGGAQVSSPAAAVLVVVGAVTPLYPRVTQKDATTTFLKSCGNVHASANQIPCSAANSSSAWGGFITVSDYCFLSNASNISLSVSLLPAYLSHE